MYCPFLTLVCHFDPVEKKWKFMFRKLISILCYLLFAFWETIVVNLKRYFIGYILWTEKAPLYSIHRRCDLSKFMNFFTLHWDEQKNSANHRTKIMLSKNRLFSQIRNLFSLTLSKCTKGGSSRSIKLN